MLGYSALAATPDGVQVMAAAGADASPQPAAALAGGEDAPGPLGTMTMKEYVQTLSWDDHFVHIGSRKLYLVYRHCSGTFRHTVIYR